MSDQPNLLIQEARPPRPEWTFAQLLEEHRAMHAILRDLVRAFDECRKPSDIETMRAEARAVIACVEAEEG